MEEKVTMLTDGQYILYKGKPLVRDKNIFVYGAMSDDYVLQLNVINTKKIARTDGTELDVPDSILGMIVSTDATKPFQERVVDTFQKQGIAVALEIGEIMLKKKNK